MMGDETEQIKTERIKRLTPSNAHIPVRKLVPGPRTQRIINLQVTPPEKEDGYQCR